MTSTQSFRESMVLEHLHNPNYICRVAAVSVSVGDSREEESPSSCLPHNDYLWHFVWKVSHPAHLLFHGDWWSWKAWEQGEKLFISFYISCWHRWGFLWPPGPGALVLLCTPSLSLLSSAKPDTYFQACPSQICLPCYGFKKLVQHPISYEVASDFLMVFIRHVKFA